MEFNKYYKRVRISVKKLILLPDGNTYIDERLYRLLSNYNTLNILNIVPKAHLREDNLYLDLSKLRKYLCSYYSLKDNDKLLENIDKLKEEIKRGKNVHTLSKTAMKNYNYFCKLDRNKYKNKKKQNEKQSENFRKMSIVSLSRFKDFIENYKSISKVNINKNDLDLLLANIIMAYTKKEERDSNKYKIGINSLKEYIKSNLDLLKENYSANGYSIMDIYKYLQEEPKENKKSLQNDNIKKFNYSFFALDEKEGEEILKNIFKNDPDDVKARNLLDKKKKLYSSFNYKKLYIGTDSFNNYIGFLLNNGYVILDTFYKSNGTKVLKDNAIYIVKDEEFEKITRMKKSEVIEKIKEGTVDVDRIIHNDKFDEVVKKRLNDLTILKYLYTRNKCDE